MRAPRTAHTRGALSSQSSSTYSYLLSSQKRTRCLIFVNTGARGGPGRTSGYRCVARQPGASTTLKPTSTVKRAVYDALLD